MSVQDSNGFVSVVYSVGYTPKKLHYFQKIESGFVYSSGSRKYYWEDRSTSLLECPTTKMNMTVAKLGESKGIAPVQTWLVHSSYFHSKVSEVAP
jgi:hypothetical protein